MKTLKMATSVLLMLGFLLSNAIRGVEAATFLGDFCWQSPNGGLAKLGVTDMGGGHFLVHGRSTALGTVVEAIHGNAEIVGQQVILTVNNSGGDALETWAGTARVVLDLSTLNGTVEALEVVHLKAGTPTGAFARRDTDTLTFIACP